MVGVSITDIMTGMYAHGAIIAALYERLSSGKGKHITASLVQSQVSIERVFRITKEKSL